MTTTTVMEVKAAGMTEFEETEEAMIYFFNGPPIFFLTTDSNGKVQKDLWNEGTKHKHVKYYYQDGEECELYFKYS